jgi:hypothetical protein
MAMSEDKKKCFVIMPISDAEGYDKGHFTRVYEHLVKPAVIEAGFEPMIHPKQTLLWWTY